MLLNNEIHHECIERMGEEHCSQDFERFDEIQILVQESD